MVLQRIFQVLFLGLFFSMVLEEAVSLETHFFLTAKYLNSTPAILSLHLYRRKVMVVL